MNETPEAYKQEVTALKKRLNALRFALARIESEARNVAEGWHQ